MNWLSRIADTFGGIINEGRELGDSAVRYSAILARFDEANDVMEGFAAQAKLDGKLELARRVEAELTGLALKAHEAFAAYRSTVNGLLPQSFKMDPGHDGLRPMLNPEYALQVSEQSAHSSNPKAVINAFLDLVETLERAWLHSLNYFRKQTGAS